MSNPEKADTKKPSAPGPADEIIVPLHAEEISISKQTMETGRVQVNTVTREHEQLVDELLTHEHVEIERIPIGKPIDVTPPVRETADRIIVPVVEEVLVVERRLVLKEEVHIHRVRQTERCQERVTLRRQEAEITRVPIETPSTEAGSISQDRLKNTIEEKR